MAHFRTFLLAGVAAAFVGLGTAGVEASQFYVQCPEDPDTGWVATPGDPNPPEGDLDMDGVLDNDYACLHVVGTDGYNMMADGRRLYSFGFDEVSPTAAAIGDVTRELTGTPPDDFMKQMQLGGNSPAGPVIQREGQRWYMTLSNFPFTPRPDLFDAHTIHYHGFPNANNFYDGVPEMSLAPNPLASLAYFYQLVEPGTYFYHCHVEATEHMQMGMFANLWVEPRQNVDPTVCPTCNLATTKYVYNDGDGSTGYTKSGCNNITGLGMRGNLEGACELPLMIMTYDSLFHDQSEAVQPLDFLGMKDDYFMINGRGYPDTVNPELQFSNGDTDFVARTNVPGSGPRPEDVATDGVSQAAQKMPSIINIPSGSTYLLRVSNLSTTDIISLHSPGLPMRVVGVGARELADAGASPNGADTGLKRHYRTHTVSLGGGRAFDILIDTAGVAAGTYYLYSSNLDFLSNNTQDIGGVMTEIVVN